MGGGGGVGRAGRVGCSGGCHVTSERVPYCIMVGIYVALGLGDW